MLQFELLRFVVIWFFCHNFRFWILLLFESLSFEAIWVFLVLLIIKFLVCCNLSFATIWVFDYGCYSISVVLSIFEFWPDWVLSPFEFFLFFSQFKLLSFVTILVFEFCHHFSFWVLSQFEFLSFDAIWVFEVCHNLSF